MVPQFARFICFNNSGQTVTYNSNGRLNLKITAIKWNDTNKQYEYTQLSDDDFGFEAGDSCADGAEEKTSEIDNTSNLYERYQVQLEVTHDEGAAADGRFDIYIDGGDATGELMSDASGYDDAETNGLALIGTLIWHSSGGDDEVMRSNVIEVG